MEKSVLDEISDELKANYRKHQRKKTLIEEIGEDINKAYEKKHPKETKMESEKQEKKKIVKELIKEAGIEELKAKYEELQRDQKIVNKGALENYKRLLDINGIKLNDKEKKLYNHLLKITS